MRLYKFFKQWKTVAALEDPPPIPEDIGKFFFKTISILNFIPKKFSNNETVSIIIFCFVDKFSENGPSIENKNLFDFFILIKSPNLQKIIKLSS